MFLAVRARAALLAAAAVIVDRSAVAADPAPTTSICIAASESGQDLRHAGKLTDAQALLKSCAAASCPGPIRDDCAQRLDEIAKSMPSIVFEVSDSAGNDVVGLTIKMDGQPFAASVGTAIELDPGEHTFTFEAPGQPMIEKRLVVVEGVKRRHEVLVIDRPESGRETTGAGSSKTLEPATITPVASNDAVAARPSGPPMLAWAAFGVGGAGLTLGVISGLVAGGKHASLSTACDNTAGTCPPAYSDDLDSFHTWRTISTISYVFGALGVAGGVTFWLTAPKTHGTTASIWLGPSSTGVVGRF